MVAIIMFLIVLGNAETKTDFTLLNYFDGEYTVYTNENVGSNSVDLGFCYMNSKPVSHHVIGESMVIQNLEVNAALDSLLARVVKTEFLEDGTIIIYAYTSLIEDNVQVEGNKVNLQIAQRDERFVVGWPLILGSY